MKPYNLSHFIRVLVCIVPALMCAGMLQAQVIYNNGDTISIGSGINIYVNGGIQNDKTGSAIPVLKNNGNLNITGDLDNHVTTQYFGNGEFEMSGSSLQSFSGAGFYDMLVSGAGEKRMIGPTHLKHSLVFTDGYINTALTKDTIFMDSLATLTETATNEVNGYVKMIRPLDAQTNYSFGNLGLDFQALGATPGITSILRATGDSAIQTAITKAGAVQGTMRYFEIHPATNAGLNANIVFHYQDGELNSLAETDLSMFRSTDSGKHWIFKGYASRDAMANTLTLGGVNSFSRWTTGGTMNQLPVELTDFTAHWKSAMLAQLDWHTSSESNNALFEVERSWNGKNFEKIGEKPGHGTTNISQSYQMEDHINNQMPDANIVYYRLKQIDFNGRFSYSEIRRLPISKSASAKMNTWYNAEKQVIVLDYGSDSEQQIPIKVIDAQGKEIVNENIHAQAGISQYELNMSGLAKGIYTIYLNNNDDNSLVKRVMRY